MATEQEGPTPGPWEARRCGELCPDRWNVIALLPTEDGKPQNIRTIDQVLDYGGAAEAEANARLIAAAPDLLKAGEGARQALWNALDHLGFECPDAHPAIVELDAAIARATGEA